MSKRLISPVTCILALWSLSASAEVLDANTRFFEIDRTLVITADDHRALARTGQTQVGLVALSDLRAHPEDTIANAVGRQCGENRPVEAQRDLQAQAREMNGDLIYLASRLHPDLDPRAAAAVIGRRGYPIRLDGGEVFVPVETPFCIGVTPEAAVVAQAGDSVASIIRAALPGIDPALRYQSVYAANTAFFEARKQEIPQCRAKRTPVEIVRCVNTQIRAGDRIIVPLGPETISVVLTPESERELGRLAANAQGGRSPPSERGVRLVHAADPLLANAPDCAGVAGPGTFPFDSGDIWRRFQHQRGLQAQSARVRYAVIGVIDAGVHGPEAPVLPESLFAKLEGEDVVDIWGDNVVHDGDIEPTPGAQDGHHGTQVVDVATGGQAFRDGAAASASAPVRLRVFSLAAADEQPVIWPSVALTGIETLLYRHQAYDDVRPHIVNLSLEQDGNGETWGTTLFNTYKESLFSAAAGNGRLSAPPGPRYLQAASDQVFPAALGGADRLNLLVVTALDREGALAPFSNVGPEIVELAAPGCNLRLLDQRYVPRDTSGTSFAAPQATFAAALVYALMNERLSPLAIKQRLIYSADFRDSLSGEIRLGAVLNIARAISVHSDVLTRTGAPEPGQLFERSGLIDICPAQPINPAPLRFIGRRLSANRFEVDRVHVDSRGRVTRRLCRNAPIAARSLMFRPDVGADVDLSTLATFDLLLRER